LTVYTSGIWVLVFFFGGLLYNRSENRVKDEIIDQRSWKWCFARDWWLSISRTSQNRDRRTKKRKI